MGADPQASWYSSSCQRTGYSSSSPISDSSTSILTEMNNDWSTLKVNLAAATGLKAANESPRLTVMSAVEATPRSNGPDVTTSAVGLKDAAGSKVGSEVWDERFLIQMLTATPDGAKGFLRQSIIDNDIGQLKLCARRKDVLAEEYPWAKELLDDGYPEDEVLDLILKSENLDWTGPDESSLSITPPFDTAVIEHQAHRAHHPTVDDAVNVSQLSEELLVESEIRREESAVKSATSAYLQTCLPKQDAPPQITNPGLALQALEERERNLIRICGVGGVFPPASLERFNPGYAKFRGADAEIILGEAKKSGDAFVALSERVDEVLTNVLAGLRLLTSEGVCCSTFTYLVKSHSRPRVVELRSITAQQLEDIRHIVNRMSSSHLDFSPPTQRCVDALEYIGLYHLSAAILHPAADAQATTSVISCLHACALIAQIAALSLVFYSRGHSREFYCEWVTCPIESFKLAGLGVGASLSVYAERRELACMGKMLGRRVWVFYEKPQQPQTTTGQYFLSTNIENLLNTWGGGLSMPENDSNSVISVHTGGGSITRIPKDETCEAVACEENGEVYCHWQFGYVTRDVQLVSFPRNATLIIGATSVNSHSPLTH